MLSDSPCAATRAPAETLSALAHPARIAILRRLAAEQCCCCKDVLGGLDLAQSTVSQHLKVLFDAGLIHRAGEGRRSGYVLDGKRLYELADWLNDLAGCCGKPAKLESIGQRPAHG